MNNHAHESGGLLLRGLDGANPLAYLAALGTLRALSDYSRTDKSLDNSVRLAWQIESGAWRPIVHTKTSLTPSDLAKMLHKTLCGDQSNNRHVELGKNLSVPPAEFARHAGQAAWSGDQRWADYIASFGSEVLRHEKLDRIDYTELCFVFGSGHQHYLETMAKLAEAVTPAHLEKSLFTDWDYSDERLSFRWDPADAKEHAYQWMAPGDETTRTMWGANLLAAEGSSLFVTCPTRRGKGTVCVGGRGSGAAFTWPVWLPALGLDPVRSLLSCPDLLTPGEILQSRGVAVIYRSFKVKIGEGANFKWSFSPAVAV